MKLSQIVHPAGPLLVAAGLTLTTYWLSHYPEYGFVIVGLYLFAYVCGAAIVITNPDAGPHDQLFFLGVAAVIIALKLWVVPDTLAGSAALIVTALLIAYSSRWRAL